jgi:hypothetical protein
MPLTDFQSPLELGVTQRRCLIASTSLCKLSALARLLPDPMLHHAHSSLPLLLLYSLLACFPSIHGQLQLLVISQNTEGVNFHQTNLAYPRD